LKRIAGKLEATTVVLQSRQPWHSNSTLSYPVLLAFPYKRAWKSNLRGGTRKLGEQERNRRKKKGQRAKKKT
jgi:hypothetical protein